MASKQLNFFITPEEHSRINKMILEKEIIVLLNKDIKSMADFEILEKLPAIGDNVFQVYLTNSRFMDKIIIRSTDNGIKYFDINRSYLLEFDLGGFYPYDINILQRARFYYVKSFYNTYDNLENKSNSYFEWCDGVIRSFKKEFLKRYSKDKEDLYSQSAIEWIEKNDAVKTGGGLAWKKP